jgi:hypothetical protein
VIEVPLSAATESDSLRRGGTSLNVRIKNSKQLITLRRLRRGLEDTGAKLIDGSEVNDNSKVIRWLLEQVGLNSQQ